MLTRLETKLSLTFNSPDLDIQLSNRHEDHVQCHILFAFNLGKYQYKCTTVMAHSPRPKIMNFSEKHTWRFCFCLFDDVDLAAARTTGNFVCSPYATAISQSVTAHNTTIV